MRVSLSIIAALVATATAAGAEPARHEAPKPASAAKPAGPVVLASADSTRVSANLQPSNAPAKPVTPRVTTCRCGDPAANADTEDQDQ